MGTYSVSYFSKLVVDDKLIPWDSSTHLAQENIYYEAIWRTAGSISREALNSSCSFYGQCQLIRTVDDTKLISQLTQF